MIQFNCGGYIIRVNLIDLDNNVALLRIKRNYSNNTLCKVKYYFKSESNRLDFEWFMIKADHEERYIYSSIMKSVLPLISIYQESGIPEERWKI